MANTDKEKEYKWKEEQEHILRKWADKAMCYKIMHERSHRRFWCLNAWFNIPVIIISTITGTGNFASGSLEGSSSSSPMIIGANGTVVDSGNVANTSIGKTFVYVLGALNISAGILATIATYTGVAQKLEAHRFACIQWDKFSRKLQIELAKTREERAKAKDFIRQSAEEYDRLIEMSPIISNDVIRWFSSMIESGKFEQELNGAQICCYEYFCFPCGCACCKGKQQGPTTDRERRIAERWSKIELPDVIGDIKPTEIYAPVHGKQMRNNDYSIYRTRSEDDSSSFADEEATISAAV
jgi:hypothetical protein